MADLAKIVDELSSLTVLEAAELAKLLEEKWGVSAAAAVAVAPARPAAPPLPPSRRRPSSRRPGRGRRQEDRRHQGSPRHHRPRPEGGQGPGRGRAEARQGRRLQGRGREDQGAAREGRRQGRAEVSVGHASACRRHPRARPEDLGPDEAPSARRPVRSSDEAIAAQASSFGPSRRFGRGTSLIDCPAAMRVGRLTRRPAPAAADARSAVDRGARSTMANTLIGRKRIRKFFGKIREVAEMPNLIEVQKASYDQFLMVDEPKGGAAGRRPAGRVQVGVPDLRLLQHRAARIRRYTSSRRNTTSTSAASAA